MDGPWTLIGPEAQQLLEEKEQALAILQETVKVGPGLESLLEYLESEPWGFWG